MTDAYIHGYDRDEEARLDDQARSLVDLLHGDTAYSPGSKVLEIGCGVGAQTTALAQRSPDARITSVDISARSLAQAGRRMENAAITNVNFLQADVYMLPFL